jgi:hypothetical protein
MSSLLFTGANCQMQARPCRLIAWYKPDRYVITQAYYPRNVTAVVKQALHKLKKGDKIDI